VDPDCRQQRNIKVHPTSLANVRISDLSLEPSFVEISCIRETRMRICACVRARVIVARRIYLFTSFHPAPSSEERINKHDRGKRRGRREEEVGEGGTGNAVNGALIYHAVTRTMSEGTSNNRKRYDFSRIRLTSCRSGPSTLVEISPGLFPSRVPAALISVKWGSSTRVD
jgi:hypothetical protein